MGRTPLQLRQREFADEKVLAAVPATVPGLMLRELARATGFSSDRVGRSIHRLREQGLVVQDRTRCAPLDFATGGQTWKVTYRRGV